MQSLTLKSLTIYGAKIKTTNHKKIELSNCICLSVMKAIMLLQAQEGMKSTSKKAIKIPETILDMNRK